jgi:hypothetical protein
MCVAYTCEVLCVNYERNEGTRHFSVLALHGLACDSPFSLLSLQDAPHCRYLHDVCVRAGLFVLRWFDYEGYERSAKDNIMFAEMSSQK